MKQEKQEPAGCRSGAMGTRAFSGLLSALRALHELSSENKKGFLMQLHLEGIMLPS